MPCIPIPNGHLCVRGRQRREYCETDGCGKVCVALCDFPIATPIAQAGRPGASAKVKKAVREMHPTKTCDRRMCGGCRNKVGPDRDYCADHLAESNRQGTLAL